MSFVIAVYVREGIVLASDSRLTLNQTTADPQGQQIQQLSVGMTDSTYKTFLTLNGIGISTYGDADIQGVPISGYIETFIRENVTPKTAVDEVPQRLIDHFSSFPTIPDTGFLVAGYKTAEDNKLDQQVWRVIVANSTIERVNELVSPQGASWGGETDVLGRILGQVFILDQTNSFSPVASYGIPYQFFTLQDAIDFAVYAIRATIDTIHFQQRPKTVGGPVDVLVIKPDDAFWVQRKELRVQ